MSLTGNNETSKLQEFLGNLKDMEKQFGKISSDLNVNIGGNIEKIMKEHTYEEERKTKLNKKACNMQLAKDGSIRIVFDNPEDGRKFYKGEK